jgi:hypothetical protein
MPAVAGDEPEAAANRCCPDTEITEEAQVGSSTSVNIVEAAQDSSIPWMIIIACLIIALLGLILGMMWLRARKARRAHGHLDAHIARPESLADEQKAGERRL